MDLTWNPWHGCTKVSPGCLNCYVYRIDRMHGTEEKSSLCRRTADFYLPVKKDRKGEFKASAGTVFYTCFTSDFFIKDADEWREEAWTIIRQRSDCEFFFYTKRIERFEECIPKDWGEGYENVTIGCTAENQAMADRRIPVFLSLPIKHRTLGIEPMLEKINIIPYLDGRIMQVSAGGESGQEARICDYDWILDLRRQCAEKNTAFSYHQTGEHFVMDGRSYNIPRKFQHQQAKKAGIDYIPR